MEFYATSTNPPKNHNSTDITQKSKKVIGFRWQASLIEIGSS